MPKIIQPGGKTYRAFDVQRDALDAGARTVSLAFSSESPYDRSWGREILDHAPDSVDLSRLKAGAPLLIDHDNSIRSQVGVVESVSLDADRIGRAKVRLGNTPLANEVFQQIQDGIIRNVSVGYQINSAKEESRDADGYCTFRVNSWTPFEISLVPVPADFTGSGIGRSAEDTVVVTVDVALDGDGEADDIAPADVDAPPLAGQDSNKAAAKNPSTPSAPSCSGDIEMSEIQSAQNEGRAAELARASTIIAIGEQFKLERMAAEALRAGHTVEEFRAAVMEKLASGAVSPALGMEHKEARAYSVRNAILAAAAGNWKNAGLERAAHEAIVAQRGGDPMNGGFYVPYDIQQRDMTSAGASGSNYLVATDNLAGSFIEMLRARSVLAQLGATMLSGLTGNVTIPKMTAASTAYWLTNEATAITESQPTIGQLSLTPKTVGAYTELSRLMLLQSTPAADALVMSDFAKVLALAIDAAGIAGPGTGGAPTGITGTAGIGGVTGTSIALAGVMEFQSDVATANALTTGCAYLTTPAVASLLAQRQRFSSTDTPLWTGNLIDGNVLGYRGTTTTQMTAAAMLFGDFSQVVIGEWGQLELAVTNSEASNFKAGILGVRAFQSVDVGIRQAGAFSLATSIT